MKQLKTTLGPSFKAASVYLLRGAGVIQPLGNYDSGGRWYPDDDEWCPCCTAIREPSRAFPFSLRDHCRTQRHLVSRYDADPKLARKLVRQLSATIEAFQAENKAAFATHMSTGVDNFGGRFADASMNLLVQLNRNVDTAATIDRAQLALTSDHTVSLTLQKRIKALRNLL